MKRIRERDAATKAKLAALLKNSRDRYTRVVKRDKEEDLIQQIDEARVLAHQKAQEFCEHLGFKKSAKV